MPKESTIIRPADRPAILQQQRRLKMARSAHAYVRGNTLRFYDWLLAGSGDKLPSGPPIWICGDCHLGNLGPVADADGHIEIEIRDLDQTVIGNPAHDLIRLGLSLATAARGSDLPGVTTALMIEQMVLGYEHALAAPRIVSAHTGDPALKPIADSLNQATRRRWRHLAEERIEDVTPVIPLGRRYWSLSDDEKTEVERLFGEEKVRELIVSLNHRPDDAKIRVLDAAYWMKGCSSLGRLRYAVLAGVGRKRDHHYCLIDIKEAIRAAAPAARLKDQHPPMPRDNAQRVVTGACALSPFLGERMLASTFLGRSVVLRELMPQDLKLEMDRMTREQATAAARYLAGVVGRAHARQIDLTTRRAWRAELRRNRPKTLDAPGWLWRSVVELVATHETAYLEHCRRFAMA